MLIFSTYQQEIRNMYLYFSKNGRREYYKYGDSFRYNGPSFINYTYDRTYIIYYELKAKHEYIWNFYLSKKEQSYYVIGNRNIKISNSVAKILFEKLLKNPIHKDEIQCLLSKQ